MATKKAGATAKKTTTKVKSTAAKPSTTTTKVTTVKATDASAPKPAARVRRRPDNLLVAALVAEFIGTFLLTIAIMGLQGNPFYVAFAIAGIVLMVGMISGAHLNPAITVGAWVTRKINSVRALTYVVAQVLGAGLAFTTLKMFLEAAPQQATESSAMLGQSAPQLFKVATLTDKNQWAVFFIELIAAAIFTFGVAAIVRGNQGRLTSAFTVGLSLLVAGVFGIITGGYVLANSVFNPAAAVALQAVDWGNFNMLTFAAYMIAPLVGGVIGFGLRDVLTANSKKEA